MALDDYKAATDQLLGASAPAMRRVRVADSAEGQRLDRYLAISLPELSRTQLKTLVQDGMVSVSGEVAAKVSVRLKPGEEIVVRIPPLSPSQLVPEEVPFVVLYEDEDLVVLSKPPGVVVHPACGHQSGTLVHGLLHHCGELSGISGEQRPGIVHRLDKDTSGAMVVAKNDHAHRSLIHLFKERKVKKVYHALVDGRPDSASGRVALPIGRHPVARKKMAVCHQGGREAVTRWKTVEELPRSLTLLEITLETGRTHQIRVHMAALGHPVAGDPVYGRTKIYFRDLEIKRQCLHASMLSFSHPVTGEDLEVHAPLWPDIASVLDRLRSG